MPSKNSWDKLFLDIAYSVSSMSKDPSTQVGAVIVSEDNRKISFGYNGFVRGIDETVPKWERPRKYQYVQHAELNAIINCPFDTIGCTLYCTHQPCHRCIGMVAQAGIKRVVYARAYANLEYKDIWQEHADLFDEVIELPYDPLYDRKSRAEISTGVKWLPMWLRRVMWKLAGTPQ